MDDLRKRKLLMPKTAFAKASVLYFCLIWWLLNNKPVMQIFDSMAKPDNMVWLFGMPINFAYIIAVALLTVVWTIAIFAKWEVGDDDE